jgi:molybdopterin converting factor small subunit
MTIKVNLTPYFHEITKKNVALEANGRTVQEVIEDIDKKYPGFKKECIDEQGKLHGFLEIYINQESAFPDELKRKVTDNDEITILTIIGGG